MGAAAQVGVDARDGDESDGPRVVGRQAPAVGGGEVRGAQLQD